MSRMCFVKDEKNFDKFDIAFGKYFESVDAINDLAMYQIPDDWLRKQMESMLSDEEKAKIEALGGLEKPHGRIPKANGRSEEETRRRQ